MNGTQNKLNKFFNTVWNVISKRGIILKTKQLAKFDFKGLINVLSSNLAYHGGNPKDIHIQYDEFYIAESNFFNFLLSKDNSSLVYQKLQNATQDKIENFASKIKYIFSVNEQIETKSTPGTVHYMADHLSIFIEYTDGTMGIVRITFKNSKTSYIDQGKIVTILSANIYLFFCQEHDLLPKVDLNSLYLPKPKQEIINLVFNRVKDINRILFFREPGPGQVFGKREYKYSANYYYIESLHTKAATDLRQASIIENKDHDSDQSLAYELYKDIHGEYSDQVCYFNFVNAYKKIEDFDSYIPNDIYEEVMEFINLYYFETVTDQQVVMYNMIKNKIQASCTKNIQSCCYSNLEFVEKELKKLDEHAIETKCIKKFIDMLKDTATSRINPGAGYFYNMINSSEFCDKYIVKNFASSILWMNWEDNIYFAKAYLCEYIGEELYSQHHTKLESLLNKIFGEKSILYENKRYSRGIFYQEIIDQFNNFGEFEQKERKRGNEISIDDILKPRKRKDAEKLLYGKS